MSAVSTAAIPAAALRGFPFMRWLPWIVGAALLVILPTIFTSGLSLTVMSVMGIAIVFALSYNIILGQTGMLSFGHAVYYGLGAYFTVHAINACIASGLPVPLPFMPLIGGVAGLVFAMAFGWLSTKRSGTAFAMISLGLAELVGSSSLILRSFFGGEEGISTNRARLPSFLGYHFGPQIEVYYLIAFWMFMSAAAMYYLTTTPLGRMCNAVRENPSRVAYLGFNPQAVRYRAFCIAGFFGGIAGGLATIDFELANAQLFSATQSAIPLIAAYIGGAGVFAGPIFGAILVTYLQNILPDITPVWQLYFGLLFIGTVIFAPGGLAGIVLMHRPLVESRQILRVVPSYALAVCAVAVLIAGLILTIEMTAHATIHAADGPSTQIFGQTVNVYGWQPWLAAAGLLIAGIAGLRTVSPIASRAFSNARQPASAP